MKKESGSMYRDNERAMIGQPIYLIVALVIATTIFTIFTFAMMSTSQQSQAHQVQCEIDKIITEATNMFEYADEGSIATIHVEFPYSMQFLVFGGLPTNDISIPNNLTLQENTSNNYYVVMNDGTLKTFHSNTRFSDKNETTIAVFFPGSYDLTLESSYWEGKTYVKIYERH